MSNLGKCSGWNCHLVGAPTCCRNVLKNSYDSSLSNWEGVLYNILNRFFLCFVLVSLVNRKCSSKSCDFFPSEKKGIFWRTGLKFRSHGSLKKWSEINKITFSRHERSAVLTKEDKMPRWKNYNECVQRGRSQSKFETTTAAAIKRSTWIAMFVGKAQGIGDIFFYKWHFN